VPTNVEQINDYLFIDNYKRNKIKIGVKNTYNIRRRVDARVVLVL